MRIRKKNGEYSKAFKLRSDKENKIGVIWMQIGKMKSVRDSSNMHPSYDAEEFALGCLDILNEFYLPQGEQKITKQNMAEPIWKHFKESCNREWHYEKSNNKFLRSYYFDGKGWLKLKVDNNTPKDCFDKLGIQSHDKIVVRIEKHNERLSDDAKRIGQQPRGFLGYKE